MSDSTVQALSVTETLDIAASADAVWAVMGKFDALAQWALGIASSHADMTKVGKTGFKDVVPLEAPEDPGSPFANSPFSRCLGIVARGDGTTAMPFARHLIGNPILPALHGGLIGAFLETAAIVSVRREVGLATAPKPI